MKKELFNVEYVSGRLYQHNLVKKTVQNKESKNFGTEFISGTVDIVTDEEGNINVNPNSLTVLEECYLEPAFKDAKPYDRFQFVRQGFFCVDYKDSTKDKLVFNRIVSLKSSFKLPK